MDNLSCLILAGGQSKRFGENKALYVFNGKSLFERVLETALKVTDDVIISVRDVKNLDEFRYALITVLNKIYNDNDSKLSINCKSNLKYKKKLIELSAEIQFDNCKIYGNINDNYNKIKKGLRNNNIEANEDNRHNNKKNLNFKIIADTDDKDSILAGPLKGIFSCFNYLKNDYVLLMECDAPFFNYDCATILINKIQNGEGDKYKNFDAVVPIWSDSTIEPLLACYNRKKTLDILSMLNSYALNLANYFDFIYNDAINIARFIGRVYYFSINDIIKENNRIKSEYFRNINDKDSLIGILKKINYDNDNTKSVEIKKTDYVDDFCNAKLCDKESNGDNKSNGDEKSKHRDRDRDRDIEYRKSTIAVTKNNFSWLSDKLGYNKKNKKNITKGIYNGKLAKPYGYLSNQLYYLKLYCKSKNNINNSGNIGNNNYICDYDDDIINNYDRNNNKNNNENNNKNNADKIYLKKLILYLNKEKNFYLNKDLFFMAAKIQKAINLYKKL